MMNSSVNMTFVSQTSDLGALMGEALREYLETTRDLLKDPSMEARSMNDVEAYIANHVDNFKKFRHPGTKFDVLRSAIGRSLNIVQAMSNVLAGPTTAGFPAAAPVFTAVNLLVFTGNRVKADFDNLMDFLDEVGSCINSISIVEGFVHGGNQIPQLDEDFKRVFGAVLTLCGVSTKYIKDGRLTRGLKGLFGNDRILNASYVKLQKSMVTLDRSITNGIFRGVVVQNEGMADLQKGVEGLEIIVKEARDDIKEMKDQKMRNDVRIQNFFKGYIPWEDVLEAKKEKFVAGTEDWMFNDSQYKTWYGEGDKSSFGRGLLSLLCISGGTGFGKSMLAYKIADSLRTYTAEYRGSSIACFFFSEKEKSLKTALRSLVVQISEYDKLYSKRIASLIKNSNLSNSDSMGTITIWKTFIADQYPNTSTRGRLYLILDGTEELTADDEKALQVIVSQIISDKLNIKLLLSGQSQLNEKFGWVGEVKLPQIEITAECIHDAVKVFIDHRVGKFRLFLAKSFKDTIIRQLSYNADGFAFVDALLNDIEAIDQAEDIPSVLQTLPSTFKDLFRQKMDRILRNQSAVKDDRIQALKVLLYWSAVAKRYLTVRELHCILALKTKYKMFSVVAEVKRSLASVLVLEKASSEVSNVPENISSEPYNTNNSTQTNGTKTISKSEDEIFGTSYVKFNQVKFDACFLDNVWTTEVSNKLIENTHTAQLDIALTTMRVLSSVSSDPFYTLSRDLEKYSATSWADHLADLNMENYTEDEISRVVKSIKAIFTTPETFSLVLERQDFKDFETYASALVPTQETADENRGVIMQWLIKTQKIGLERLTLSADEFEWVEMVIASPPALLTPVAEEHVRHWFKEIDITNAYKKFEFALSAFRATGLVPRVSDDSEVVPEADIITISEACTDYNMDEDALRGIGATFSNYGYNERAVEYYLKAQDYSKESTVGNFYTLVGLGRAYLKAGQYKDAEKTLSSALDHREEILLQEGNQELARTLLHIAYKQLGRTILASNNGPPSANDAARAIDAYELSISFNDAENVYLADMIFEVLLNAKDPAKMIQKVFSWESNLFTSWLLEDLHYEPRQQVELQKAAKQTGKVEDLINCYKKAIAERNDPGAELLILVELSSINWKVLKNEDLAYAELTRHMDSTDTSRNANEARHRASGLLSEMMYGRIKLLPTHWMRQILTANLAAVSGKDTVSAADPWNIRPNIPLAAAYLACNQPKDALPLLDSSFSQCIEWLRDDVSWNDDMSLRLLAKLLKCVGLRKDAAIAYSATLSKLDENSEPGPGQLHDATSKDSADIDTTNDERHAIDHPSGTEEELVLASIHSTTGKLEQKSVESEDTITLAPDKGAADRLLPEANEDLSGRYPSCDGCGAKFPFWVKGKPYHLCIICRDIDLCNDCYNKQMLLNRDDDSAMAVGYCGAHHDYVKAPTEGWGGIKDGVMSIYPEKTEFQHWLRDLEKRWEEWKETGAVDP